MGDDFILEFQLSRKNEWNILKKSILFHFAAVFGFIYFLFTKELMWLYLGVGFLIIICPQIILHIQYRLVDTNKIITVNYSKQTVTIEKNKNFKKEFLFKDVRKIIRYKGQTNEGNMGNVLPMSFYNYTEISLLNGERIFYTDLITKNIGLNAENILEKISLLNFIV